MHEITQIRKLSLWVFFIPLISINLCLFISQNYHLFDHTILSVDMIGRSGFSIPYLDGSLSISRASRTFPQYLIFKPAMILTAIFLFYYWSIGLILIKYDKTSWKFLWVFIKIFCIWIVIVDDICLVLYSFKKNVNGLYIYWCNSRCNSGPFRLGSRY